jgi:hypothetical protein
MRHLVVISLLLAASPAVATPIKPGIVWDRSPHRSESVPFTPVSRVLYLNNCLPDGCAVRPGHDDSRGNFSSIPLNLAVLDAWSYGDAYWERLVTCVKETFAPFDIEITTTDPGTVSHFEVMVGGLPAQLTSGLEGAGGVAPFLSCGAQQDNVISFVFSGVIDDLEFLCGAVAQEAGHVWGLDHSLDALDPMTYLDLGSRKIFQDTDAPCGEDTPRACFCGGATQNSTQYLFDTFGPATLEPPSMKIVSPRDGAWVTPGFVIEAAPVNQLSISMAWLAIDGVETHRVETGPYTFTAPELSVGSDHVIQVLAVDVERRSFAATIDVHVTTACDGDGGCPSDQYCLGGACLAGPDFAGGLGATCTSNDECITGTCGASGDEQRCTGPCDDGTTCPDGFACVGVSAGNGVCWPDEGGGCSAGRGGSHGLVLVGLSALVIIRRRRKLD